MKIVINGHIVDEQQAVVSAFDHGFLYGIGLFETFRTYGGRTFLLEEHLDRLARGCVSLGIRHEPEAGRMTRDIAELLAANRLNDAYIRYTVTAGTGALGLPADDYAAPTTVLYMKPLPPRDEAVYSEGRNLQLLKLRRNTPEGETRLKSLHYMNNILAKKELRSYPWAAGAEGLFLTEQDWVAEGIVSNVFFIRGSCCYTPAVDTGILPGVTRKFVLQLAAQDGLAVEEGHYTMQQLIAADEVFITNSIQEIVPIRAVFDPDGKCMRIGGGKTGPHTAALMREYAKQTGGE